MDPKEIDKNAEIKDQWEKLINVFFKEKKVEGSDDGTEKDFSEFSDSESAKEDEEKNDKVTELNEDNLNKIGKKKKKSNKDKKSKKENKNTNIEEKNNQRLSTFSSENMNKYDLKINEDEEKEQKSIYDSIIDTVRKTQESRKKHIEDLSK